MKKMGLWLLFLAFSLHAEVGVLGSVSGTVVVEREGGILEGKKSMPLLEKDVIRTGKRSKAKVILNDETAVTLSPEASFSIQEYSENQQQPKVKLNIASGTLKVFTGKIAKVAPSNFRIETPTATIGVRGTTIRIHITEAGSQVCCLAGAITVTNKNKDGSLGEALDINKGFTTFVREDNAPSKPAKTEWW